jgi:hypothetical protein
MMKARGSFDPVLKSQFDQKQFDDKQYYQLNTNQIEIPTALGGLKLKAGYDRNTGSFVNPENQLPENGLAYAGVAIPIGAGLFFDERRQAVRQAEVFEQATLLERQHIDQPARVRCLESVLGLVCGLQCIRNF